MIRRLMLAVAGLAAFVTPGAAAGQTPPPADPQSIRVGATIFFDYTFTNSPKKIDADGNEVKQSAFDVKRAYININGTVSRLVSFRITPDIKRETGNSSLNGSLSFRIKYAFVQFNLAEWLPSGSRIRLGIHQTPFIEAQEDVYRYRFQGTVFAERDGGLSSADAGVSFRTMLPSDYGDVQVGLYNGEGYTGAEANDQKSLQLRATVHPWPKAENGLEGLRLIGFVMHDHYVRDAQRRRFIGSAMYEHEKFSAGFDALAGSDQVRDVASDVDTRGVSFFVNPYVDEKGKGVEGLFRFDHHRTSAQLDGRLNRVIVGGAYWFPHPGGSATAALLVNYEQVAYSGALFSTRPKEQRLAVHGLINF